MCRRHGHSAPSGAQPLKRLLQIPGMLFFIHEDTREQRVVVVITDLLAETTRFAIQADRIHFGSQTKLEQFGLGATDARCARLGRSRRSARLQHPRDKRLGMLKLFAGIATQLPGQLTLTPAFGHCRLQRVLLCGTKLVTHGTLQITDYSRMSFHMESGRSAQPHPAARPKIGRAHV